jgi:hypothetical protein
LVAFREGYGGGGKALVKRVGAAKTAWIVEGHAMLALAVSSHPSPGDPLRGELTISLDPATNLIRVVGRGFWSLAYVSNHLREFEKVLFQARRSDRPSRTLVDLREAPVQAPDVAACLHSAVSRMYRPPERAAIVVASSLVKIQMKRGFNPETHAVFLSLKAAELWLGA